MRIQGTAGFGIFAGADADKQGGGLCVLKWVDLPVIATSF